MRYLSVCSGIEAATVAWHPLGWTAAAFSEIEAFPRAVLSHHYPTVPLHGDFTTIEADEYGPVDLLVGGTPCQDFSVAGLRAGIAGDRGNLTLEYLRLAARLEPRWIVWENVPGVLSSDGGRALGAFLGGLAEIGYGFAYRVLDAQHFGLAQRRARVFVVGYLGDWRRAAAVLFERESLQGHPAPRREAGERIANSLVDRPDRGGGNSEGQRLITEWPAEVARTRGGGGLGTDFDCDGRLIAFGGNNCSGPIDLATACQANGSPHGRLDFGSEAFITHSPRAEGFDASEDGTGRGTPLVAHAFDARQSDVIQYGDKTGPLDTDGHSTAICFTVKDHGADAGEISPTLRSGGHHKSHANGGVMPAVAFMENVRGELRTSDVTDSLKGSGGKPGQGYQATVAGSAVRRLTPRECERLQGFPDDYTLIPLSRGQRKAVSAEMAAYYRRTNQELTDEQLTRLAADGPRYKALGNSMAVPVMAWIGRRIQMVEDMTAFSSDRASAVRSEAELVP